MAPESGTVDTRLAPIGILDLLRAQPQTFEFFQCVRVLERLYRARHVVGRFSNPASEVVRFASHVSIVFPASQIQALQLRDEGPHHMVVNFMGLHGPLGVLPLYYSELLLQRERARDYAMRDFFDIFNHRAISLFYQAWEKYRFTVAYEREERDVVSHHLLDLIGLGTKGLQDRQEVADDSLIYYGGLFSLHPRSAQALKQVLMDYFEVPVAVEQFIGGWYPLDRASQCCFEDGVSYSEQLSVGAVVGDEIWDVQSAVRVVLGPLSLAQYLDFLPNGTAYAPLRALLKFFANGQIDFEVQLVLKREEVPFCELGVEAEAAPLLGWCTWAKTIPLSRDPGDTILRM